MVKRVDDLLNTEIPWLAKAWDMKSEEYVYDVMPLRRFASLNIVSQMNKAVPILLDILGQHETVLPEMKDDLLLMKDDLKAIKGNIDTIHHIL